MSEIDPIIPEFIAESRENLDRLDRDLVELERNPTAADRLASIFRAVHSIKGATGFLGFSKLGAVAHAGEDLLSRLRDRSVPFDPEIASGLLAMVDFMRSVLLNIERTGAEGKEDSQPLIRELTRLLKKDSNGSRPVEVQIPAASSDARLDGDTHRKTNEESSAHNSIRVDVRQLDKLMNLVGELVLTRNELLQSRSAQPTGVSQSTAQRLNSITTELQDEIMKARLQPIDNVWSKFPRLVRDLTLHAGKKARIEMSGRETELDRTLIEAITDPLTHLVRNAIDHGIETPDMRIAAGKPPEGRLWLKASHEGGQVDIEVADDGAGIDLARVKHKAVEKGIVSLEQTEGMNDLQATSLLFFPGFSTAENVTSISGRGVGMDVVKNNIEKIGGDISIDTRLGVGTTVKVKIPLTLAIMPALIVEAGRNRYAIPQVSVLELVRVESGDERQQIEWVQNASVFRLRGDLLPLIWLGAELTSDNVRISQSPEANRPATIVFLQSDGNRFGLVVDDVGDTQEIVIKPLSHQLRGISIFAGATIMGNGEVVLILDVGATARRAGLLRGSATEQFLNTADPRQEHAAERQELLLFTGPDDGRMAVPLSQVTRLEKFARSSLERARNQHVVQYRGDILPLTEIRDLLPERRLQPRSAGETRGDEDLHTIVYSKDGAQVGVIVGEIIDTVEHARIDVSPATRPGVLATAVIEGRVTEILDFEALCADLLASVVSKELSKA